MGEFDIKVLCDYPSSEGLRKISVGTCGLVCSSQIDMAVDGDIIRKVQFTGGCNGNTQGLAALVAGMKVKDAIARLEGIDCGGRGTSCPDQLASAIDARRLHVRKDGQPVSVKQVWWAVKNFPDTLTYAEGRVFLMI